MDAVEDLALRDAILLVGKLIMASSSDRGVDKLRRVQGRILERYREARQIQYTRFYEWKGSRGEQND